MIARPAWRHIRPARSELAFAAVLTAIGAICAPAAAAGATWPGADGLGTSRWPLSPGIVVGPDTTPPLISITSPTDGQHVALNGTLKAAFTCVDEADGSGAKTCTSNAVDTSTAGIHTFTVMTSDFAGNTDSKSVNYVVDADTTGPVITISAPVEGQHYAFGAGVTPSVACSDAGSGVAHCDAPGLVDTSSAGPHGYTVTATDNVGNPSSKTVHYVVDPDTTPPVITITSPTEGQHVALNSTLTASYSCQDTPGGSGATSCTSNAIDTSTAGQHTFTVSTSDAAGNMDSKSVHYVVDLDTTPPVITILTPTEGQHFALGAAVAGAFSCDGTGTAVTACDETAPLNTSTAGAHTYTVAATDAAGNSASATVDYVVDPASGGAGGGGGTGGGGTGTGTGDRDGNRHRDRQQLRRGRRQRAARALLARHAASSFTPSAAGAIRLLVRCTGAATCRGTAKITVPRKAATVRSAATATIVIASARYAVAARKSARIVIKLNPIGRKRVRLSRTALRATLTMTPSDRRIKAVKRSIRLKRASR